MSTPKTKTKRRGRGISTGYDPKTGKVGYTRSVKPKKPERANYASSWAERFVRS